MKTADLSYVQVSFSDETSELHSAWMAAIHGENRSTENKLGVDYPNWESDKPYIGALTLRILSDANSLQAFCAQPKIRRLAALCSSAMQVLPAPAASTFAAVTRDTRSDKVKPAYARRMLARAAKRGVSKDTFTLEGARTAQFAIPINSVSTEQNFLLKMRKTNVPPATDVLFNSYGLCKEGGLPQF